MDELREKAPDSHPVYEELIEKSGAYKPEVAKRFEEAINYVEKECKAGKKPKEGINDRVLRLMKEDAKSENKDTRSR